MSNDSKQADDKLLETITDVIREIKSDSRMTLEQDSRLITDLGLESIDIVDVTFELEKKTNVKIDLGQMVAGGNDLGSRRFTDIKVKDILSYVKKQI